MKTKLSLIENPSGLIMRLAYWSTRKKFGKVLTPIKVIYARLPLSFSFFPQKLAKLEKSFSLSQYLAVLIRTHVAQLNTCHFCIDYGKAEAIKHFGSHQEKFFSLSDYKESPLFSTKEKAALRFAEELTLQKKISQATFSEAQQHFTERELVEIAWAVMTEHTYNLLNLAFDIESDGLCQLPNHSNVQPIEHQILVSQ